MPAVFIREKKKKGESKVNLSKRLLYGVQTDNGLINGTMSRSGRAIIANDLSL